MKNILAISTNTYHGFSLEEALAGIAEAGFEYVELTAVRGYTEHVDSGMDDDQLDEVKKMLAGRGLTPIALSGHSNLMDDEGIENFLKNIDLAGRLDCSFIVTATGEAHGDKDEIEDESILVNNLKKLVKRCEENEVKLVLETHGNNYPTGEAMCKLVKKLDSEYLGVNYDTANVIFYGDVQPEDDLAKGLEKTYYIHLKDKLGENQEWNFPAVGKGYLDFKKIFEIMENEEFEGPISVEIEFTPEGPGSLAEVNQAVKDSYNYIKDNLL